MRKQRKSTRKEQSIKVRRNHILEDVSEMHIHTYVYVTSFYTQTIRAVQNYTFDDWSNKFVIEFRGEEGMNLLCSTS